MAQQRAPPSVRKSRPARMVTVWQPPRRRALCHYARLIEDTPRQDTTAEVNRYAKAEQARVKRADYAAQQAQERAQWREEAEAITRHWQRHAGRTEEIRRVQEGLRAEAQARSISRKPRRGYVPA